MLYRGVSMNNEIKAITIEDNEKFLRQISTPVDIKNDSNLLNYINSLEQFCLNNEVMAMAAVQIGIPKRLIYLKNTNLEIINRSQTDSKTEKDKKYNEARVLINPIIIKRKGLTEYWEACRSGLDNCGKVLRPYIIYVEYYDVIGNKHIERFEGFESTVLSHEMDHLDGILHIDIAEEIVRLSVEERKKLRQKEGYLIHSKSGDYENLKIEKQKNLVITQKNLAKTYKTK